MQVLPAIDLLDGKAVRLHQGRYDAVTVYADDPPALAASLRGKVPILHVVDLEGARAGRAVQRDVVARWSTRSAPAFRSAAACARSRPPRATSSSARRAW